MQSDIFPSVIRSKHRLTYTAVQAVFDGDTTVKTQYADIVDDLLKMKTLAEILQNKRNKRGNIDFQTKEVYFVHDEQGNVVDVVPYQRTFAHQLIEEFMIIANESVASYAENCDYPFVYRVHDKPDEEKFANLVALMKGVGINVDIPGSCTVWCCRTPWRRRKKRPISILSTTSCCARCKRQSTAR